MQLKIAGVLLVTLCLLSVGVQTGSAQQVTNQNSEFDSPATLIQIVDRSKVIQGQYIVIFKKTARFQITARQHIERFGAGYGIVLEHVFTNLFSGFSARFGDGTLRELLKDPNIQYIEEDSTLEAFDVGSWGLDRIDQRNLPLNGTYFPPNGGEGVTAYIADTGIRSTHQEFSGRVLPGYTAVNDGKGTEDCEGHGTHVAGTLGGAVHGVAKQVKLVPVRVLDCEGTGYTSQVVAGLDWIGANKKLPAVVNMSLGGSISNTLDIAVSGLIGQGVTVVVSAGNANIDACAVSPAHVAGAITVAASDDGDARAAFSNWGTCVALFAPGTAITSSANTSDTAITTKSGTSMASPHVAGIAAMVISGNPTFTPAQINGMIMSSATSGVISDAANSPNRLAFSSFSFAPPPDPTKIMALIAPFLLERDLPTVTVKATDARASEPGKDRGMFKFTRTGDISQKLTVLYRVSGTAIAGEDYEMLSGTVTIPAGKASVTARVIPIDDKVVEAGETVIVNLDPDGAYNIGTPRSAKVTIADNDP
jgi:aqualysin 1